MSGEIAAVGASVLCLTVGQEVYGTSLGFSSEGTFADYVVMHPYELIRKPKSITHEEASAIPFAALTGWSALIRIAEIREGQRVLVNGGDEATGFAAIQLAVTNRCQVVATCHSQNIDQVLAAGVEQAIDYTAEDIKSVKGQFDVVFDTLGGAQFEKIGISVLKRYGHYIVLPENEQRHLGMKCLKGRHFSTSLKKDNSALLDHNDDDDDFGFLELGRGDEIFDEFPPIVRKTRTYRRTHRIQYSGASILTNRTMMTGIGRLVKAGRLHIPCIRTFPIAQVRAAFEAEEKRKILGKVVLLFD